MDPADVEMKNFSAYLRIAVLLIIVHMKERWGPKQSLP
jgi:hypothetical protein